MATKAAARAAAMKPVWAVRPLAAPAGTVVGADSAPVLAPVTTSVEVSGSGAAVTMVVGAPGVPAGVVELKMGVKKEEVEDELGMEVVVLKTGVSMEEVVMTSGAAEVVVKASASTEVVAGTEEVLRGQSRRLGLH